MGTIDLNLSGGQHGRVDDIKAAYERMLTPFRGRLGDREDGVTSMPLMKGDKFTGNSYDGKPIRLLFVGRAPNGWEIEFKDGPMSEIVDQIFSSAIDMKVIARGKVKDEKGNEYHYGRSPFFQLCHATLRSFGMEENWSERMAWTNLYKVAPFKHGNPDNALIRETLNDCAKILRKEISYLRPTHIVFITGDWWYKPTGRNLNKDAFIGETGIDLFEDADGLILGGGISDAFHFRPSIVITKRPEGAKTARDEHARAIFNAFADMEKNR